MSQSPWHAGEVGELRRTLTSARLLRTEVLAGLVVALALIPEAIGFCLIAGVDPQVGLFTTCTMAIVIAFTGGRSAMISSATASIAFVVAPISRSHGIDYLVATVLLGGVFQIVLSLIGAAKLMRFIPRSVMVGFVNSLAILTFMAQLPQLIGARWTVFAMVAAGIAIIVVAPRITKAIPSSLIAIVILAAFAAITHVHIATVADEGRLPDSLPSLFWPHVPLSWHTFALIAPYAFSMAVVGLLESLLTAKLVDDLTDTHSNKTREAWGQGVANIVTGLFGGMGGCGLIGQTVINVKMSGARTRISTLCAGVFLLVLVVVVGGVVGDIPMAALVAVMIMVAVATFNWHSVTPSTLRRMPIAETLVMALTMGTVVLTNNLAIGVGVGVIAAMIAFARRVAHFTQVTTVSRDDTSCTYKVVGDLFFASSNDLVYQFDYASDPDHIVIDMSASRIWDASSVATLDAIEEKYAAKNKRVEIRGLDEHSLERHRRLSGQLASGV